MFAGRDVFLWLPTGFGKSVCYEVLYLSCMTTNLEGILGLALSWLFPPCMVSLMVDQVASLKKRGVKAAIVSSIQVHQAAL